MSRVRSFVVVVGLLIVMITGCAGPVPGPSSGGSPAWDPPLPDDLLAAAYRGQPDEFTRVEYPFSTEDQPRVTKIPRGSVIYHLDNEVTAVYGPEGKRIMMVRDSESSTAPTPGGKVAPVTRILQVPSGAMVGSPPGKKNVTEVRMDGAIILTVIDYGQRNGVAGPSR